MARRTLVVCEYCGNAYRARTETGQVVVPTSDGACQCGCTVFTERRTSGSASVETSR